MEDPALYLKGLWYNKVLKISGIQVSAPIYSMPNSAQTWAYTWYANVFFIEDRVSAID